MKKKSLYLFCSILILFQLITVVGLPNYGSFLGRHYLAPFAAWGNILVMNTTWNFFSPDPASVMYFKYVYYFPDTSFESHYFPHTKDQKSHTMKDRRELYLMRFLSMDTRRIYEHFLPWLCKKNPKAESVGFSQILKGVNSFESYVKARGERFLEERVLFETHFLCQAAHLEVDEAE